MSIFITKNSKETKLISPSDLASPVLNLDYYIPSNITYKRKDLIDFLISERKDIQYSDEKIQPYGVHFGINSSLLKQCIKRPFIIIDNDKEVSGHQIHLVRRKFDGIIVASQFHFISNILFMVVDEFSSRVENCLPSIRTSLNGYSKLFPDISKSNTSGQVLSDLDGDCLSIEYNFQMLARYFSPRTFYNNHTTT